LRGRSSPDFLGRLLGWYEPGEGAGLIMSILGAILILVLYRKYRGSPA
jgi:uncharacterized membrane protein YeaQ/YmgE (transglycosylase-associated protein family)